MERKRKVLVSAGFTAALAAIAVTVACSDTAVEPKGALPSDASAAVSGRRAERRVLNRAELRQRNPHDWVGGAHNVLLDAAIKELQKPGVNIGNLCSSMQRVFSDRRSWGRYANRLPAGSEAAIREGMKASALCDDERRREITGTRRGRGRLATATEDNSVSPQAEVAFNDIITALEQSTSMEEYDAHLSNIVRDAANMTGNDSLLVFGAIAVAQATTEYWANPNVWQPLMQAVENDLAQCQAGNSEGMTFEADGVTYQCSGSEWRLVSAPSVPRSPVVQLASYNRGTSALLASQSIYEMYGIPDPCGWRWLWIGGWDIKAFGATVPFLAALKLRGLVIAGGIAAGGSLLAATVETIRRAMCLAR